MAMNVSDAKVSGQAQTNAHSNEPASARPGGADFLQAFRILPPNRFRDTGSGLKVAVAREGHGQPLTRGMRVKVRYSGWLDNGTRFDSSEKHGKPFEFTLGAGRVIKGWEEGLAGIKPGERRQLIIPPDLAYGERQVGEIPPGSTLVFNVEAVAVEDPNANPKGTMSVIA